MATHDHVTGSTVAPSCSSVASVHSCAKILLLDSDGVSMHELRQTGQKHLIEVICATTEVEALSHAAAHDFDAAILELRPERGQGSGRLIRQLQAASRRREFPVAVTSTEAGIGHRLTAAGSGAMLFLAKPVSGHDFLRAVRQLCPPPLRAALPRLLIVEQQANLAQGLLQRLEAERLEVHAVCGVTPGLVALEQLRPDLLLFLLEQGQAGGIELLRVVRADLRWRTLPILVQATAKDLAAHGQHLYEAGADDCIPRQGTLDELVIRVRSRIERTTLLKDEVERDALTGLLSRRPLLEAFTARLVEADRHRAALSTCMIDLDRFKCINDAHGHPVGDRVLARMGQILSSRFRSSDIRGRWGGEEFLVIFPGEDTRTAVQIIERARRDLAQTTFSGLYGRPFSVTLSAGVSGYPVDGVSAEELVASADRRLYRAKQLGRDRILSSGGGWMEA